MAIDGILLVDDDNIFRQIIKMQIERQQLVERIWDCPNGLAAIDFLEAALASGDEVPDIIFLDLNMPVMNGWDFLEQYESVAGALKKPVDLYVLSSSISPSDIERAESNRWVRAYLTKPISNPDIARILNHAPPKRT